MSFIPVEKYITEIVVKKSRFIGIGYPISSVEDARSIINDLKAEYSDSRHVCYGFLWGRKSTHMGMSDDGEPHGTAGSPILEVLKGSGYENILVAVIRYFGGIKLGTGGLVKAYTEIAQNVIGGIRVEEFFEKKRVNIKIPYTLYNQFKSLSDLYLCEIVFENFEIDIEIIFNINSDTFNEFNQKIIDISKGTIELIVN